MKRGSINYPPLCKSVAVFTNQLTVKRFGLVSLFNGISTLFRLFNAKAIILEEQQWYYLTHSWEDKRVHTFSKGICPKVNVIARLEYELAYYDSAVHGFNHYTTRTHTPCKKGISLNYSLYFKWVFIQTVHLTIHMYLSLMPNLHNPLSW